MTTTSTASVFRYRLPITDRPTVQLPAGAFALSVGPPRDTRDELDLWAEVEPDSPLEDRTFLVVGTGHPLPPDRGAFIGSVTTHEGEFVWHVYETGTRR